MKVLNLYAGLGGNRKLWAKRHKVTAIERNEKIAKVYKKLYPDDDLVITDAHEYLKSHLDDFDFIWSNFDIPYIDIKRPSGFINKGTVADTQQLKDWLGIQYDGNIYYEGNHCPGQILRNCVHPKVGLHILNAAEV